MFSVSIVCQGRLLDKFNKALPISYIVVDDLGKIVNNNTIFYRDKNKTYVAAKNSHYATCARIEHTWCIIKQKEWKPLLLYKLYIRPQYAEERPVVLRKRWPSTQLFLAIIKAFHDRAATYSKRSHSTQFQGLIRCHCLITPTNNVIILWRATF